MKRSSAARAPTLPEVQAWLARHSLAAFIRQAWPVIEPGRAYKGNWHIDAICQHLEAVSEGRIRQLLINIPPGHMKSLLVAVFWPCWMWLRRPSWRALFASYASDLSIRDSVKCRSLMESEWYRETMTILGVDWALAGDQNVKSYYANTATGFRIALGVGGKTTGFRGDCVICDDPLNAKDQLSEAARRDVLFWWDQAYANRLNDLESGARVVIMQRLHEDDLAGHLLRQGGWEHLCLPSEFEVARRARTSVGFQDPREAEGELLFPDMFPKTVLADERMRLLEFGYAGQHQQRPAPIGGGMFQRAWFQPIQAMPADVIARCRFWDCAGTAGSGDWTVGTLMAKTASGLYIIEDVIRGQWDPSTVDNTIYQTAVADASQTGGAAYVRIREEQEPGSSGKAIVQVRAKRLAGYDYQGVPSTGAKQDRWRPLAAQAGAGNVRVLFPIGDQPSWWRAWIDEMTTVPFARHDDQADTGAGAFNELALQGGFRLLNTRAN